MQWRVYCTFLKQVTLKEAAPVSCLALSPHPASTTCWLLQMEFAFCAGKHGLACELVFNEHRCICMYTFFCTSSYEIARPQNFLSIVPPFLNWYTNLTIKLSAYYANQMKRNEMRFIFKYHAFKKWQQNTDDSLLITLKGKVVSVVEGKY